MSYFVMRFALAAASGLLLWINRCGYLSDARLDALAAMRGLAAAGICGTDHLTSGDG